MKNKLKNLLLLFLASMVVMGSILSVIDGKSKLPAIGLVISFMIFGLVIQNIVKDGCK